MAINTAQLEADLGYIIDDMPVSLQCNGTTANGVWTDLTDGNVLEPGGFDPRNSGSWAGKKSSFATTPTAGLTVYTRGTYMRVNNVVLSPDGIKIRLDLEAV